MSQVCQTEAECQRERQLKRKEKSRGKYQKPGGKRNLKWDQKEKNRKKRKWGRVSNYYPQIKIKAENDYYNYTTLMTTTNSLNSSLGNYG